MVDSTKGEQRHAIILILSIRILLFLIVLLKNINTNNKKHKNTTGQQNKRDTDKSI